MADNFLAETPAWTPGIYQIETDDPVVGGADGISNRQARELAARTCYLKDQVAAAQAALAAHEAGNNHPEASTAAKGMVVLASDAEAEAGTDSGKAMTAAAVKAAILALTPQASTVTVGTVKLATCDDVLAGTDTTLAVTPAGLAARTATDTRIGLVQLATPAEAQAGTDTVRAVTPAGLAATLSALPATPQATTLVAGTVKLASGAEALAGTDTAKAVTPAALAAAVTDATSAAKGLVVLATNAEALAGADAAKAVTPAALAAALAASVPAATETAAGKVELATAAEAVTGTDAVRAVHPAGTKAAIDAHAAGNNHPDATAAAKGLVALASNAETLAGTDAGKAVTPAALAVKIAAIPQPINDMALYQDQKPSGTAGNAYTSGGWRTVVVNTEVLDTAGIGSVAANQITLAAGSYEVEFSFNGGSRGTSDGVQRGRLRNVTDGTTVVQSTQAAWKSATWLEIWLSGFGSFTIAAPKVFELQYYNTISTTAGAPMSSGDPEVFSTLQFRRHA